MKMFTNEDISRSLEVLQDGGLILYPTDTIWGIGCDATNPDSVKRIYDIKGRSDSKSMLILLDSESRLTGYVKRVPEITWELIDASIKPLTIIYPGAKNIARNLISEDGSIGIRIVKDDFCKELIRRYRKPIVSTSANFSGRKSPSKFNEIDPEICRMVDYVVKWRQDDNQKGTASSIIKVGPGGLIEIIR